MTKNIVKLEMEKMSLTENAIDNIMSYHGENNEMLPEKDILKNIPEKIKRFLRKDNWHLTVEKFSGRGGEWDDYNINIKIDKTNVNNVFNNRMTAYYKYPTKYGFMNGFQRINNVFGDFIQFDKYKLKIDKFEYLELRHVYKHVKISEMDD